MTCIEGILLVSNGRPLSLTPLYLDRDDHTTGLIRLLTLALRVLTTDDVNAYACPMVEQAVNQLVQVTPLEAVNERIHELTELAHAHLQGFLRGYGITLDAVKALVYPRDELM